MEVGAAVLPARAAPAWHTTSTTVTRARDERSRRHGLRFFRWGQAAVSIVCRLQRAATLLSLALTGSHCDSLPGRYPLRGKPADRIEGDSTEPSARLRTEKKEKRRRRRRGKKKEKKKKKKKRQRLWPRAAAAPPARRLCVDGPRAADAPEVEQQSLGGWGGWVEDGGGRWGGVRAVKTDSF